MQSQGNTIRIALSSTRQDSTTILSTVSSNGTVNVYDLSLLPPRAQIQASEIAEISPVVTYDTKGSRLTCVTLAEGEVEHAEQRTPEMGAKRKRESDSEAEEDEESQGFSDGDDEYSIRLRNSGHRPTGAGPETDELGPFSFPFSPSQFYMMPVFFLIQNTFSSRPICTAAIVAQCTFTIGTHSILSGASCSHQPCALFCGRRQASKDRET